MDEIVSNLAHLMRYRDRVDSAGFVDLMGKILAGRPDIGWERGPDLLDPTLDRLSLSVPELRDGGQDAWAALPQRGEGWVVDAGIPPRDWDMFFQADIDGHVLGIEGGAWCWRALVTNGSCTLALGIPPGQLPPLDAGRLRELAGILLRGELGERNAGRFIGGLDVGFLPAAETGWQPMAALRAAFAAWFPDCEHGAWLAASRRG
jgi:hypothetical protein